MTVGERNSFPTLLNISRPPSHYHATSVPMCTTGAVVSVHMATLSQALSCGNHQNSMFFLEFVECMSFWSVSPNKRLSIFNMQSGVCHVSMLLMQKYHFLQLSPSTSLPAVWIDYGYLTRKQLQKVLTYCQRGQHIFIISLLLLGTC